jgi:hypothetical protein
VATTTDAAAKRVVSAVLEDLFVPSGRTFALRFWDVTLEGPKASFGPRFTLVLRRPGSLRRMLLPPADLALGEAYLHGDFDVEGNLEEATKLVEFISTRLRSPTLLARVVRGLRKLPSDDLPKNDSTRFLRGRAGLEATRVGPAQRSRQLSAGRQHRKELEQQPGHRTLNPIGRKAELLDKGGKL